MASCQRLRWTAVLSLVLPAALLTGTSTAETVTVNTALGTLRGTRTTFLGKPLEFFLGIPYAEPPIGARRFQKPVPVMPWVAELDATGLKPSCTQPGTPLFTLLSEPSEDCLYLNVWTPGRGGPGRPVLVWIHGGGFYFGSSYQDLYNGSALAATREFVVVTLNYRLGVLGFFAADADEAPGNVGLHDQLLALRWVRDNIGAFGGDPEKVTLFGESAGAVSISAHLLSPLSSGLFHRAVTMSGSAYVPFLIESNEVIIRKSNNVARAAGCANRTTDLGTHSEQVLECLRSLAPDDLLMTAETLLPLPKDKLHPVYGEEFIPKPPCLAMSRGDFQNVDVLGGVTEDEGTLPFLLQPDKRLLEDNLENVSEEELENSVRFVLAALTSEVEGAMWKWYEKKVRPTDWKRDYRSAAAEYVSDNAFKCPHALASDRLSARGTSMYSYVFAHRSQKSPLPEWVGVPHTADIAYFFGVPLLQPDQYTDEDRDFSRDVMVALTTFARDGVPSLPHGKTWPKYSPNDPVSIYLKPGNFSTVVGHNSELCDRWREYTC